MPLLLSLSLLLAAYPNATYAQWIIMPNSPQEEGIFRFDDVFFTSESHGSLISPSGFIYTTWDGGHSWITSDRVNAYLRAVEYADDKVGLVSSLQGIVVRTLDGGLSWEDISNRIPTEHKGMCGLHYVDGIFFGTGVFHAPARFFKTEDNGNSWTVYTLDTIAFGLVDVHFLDRDRGFVFGTGLEDAELPEEGSIWYTENGGLNWIKVGSTGLANTYIWKMFFVSPDTVYASVENYLGTTPAYMYSYDGGFTWNYREIDLQDISFFDAQALGFINHQRGWLGGYGLGMYETNDGGQTWNSISEGANINRYFKVNDQMFLAAGLRLYQLDMASSSHIPQDRSTVNNPLHQLILLSSNPISDHQVQFIALLDAPTMALLGIYDQNGKLVERLHHKQLPPGAHHFSFDTSSYPKGIYYISLRTYERHLYLTIIK